MVTVPFIALFVKKNRSYFSYQYPISPMAPKVQQREKKERKSVLELLPDMLASALTNQDDFIVTYETNPDTGRRVLHVLRGKLITPCMLGTLKNRVELQQEEGSTIMTKHWKRSKGPNSCKTVMN
jgi:hypothetical protein